MSRFFAFCEKIDVKHEAARQRSRFISQPSERETDDRERYNKQLYTIFHFVKLHLIAVSVN